MNGKIKNKIHKLNTKGLSIISKIPRLDLTLISIIVITLSVAAVSTSILQDRYTQKNNDDNNDNSNNFTDVITPISESNENKSTTTKKSSSETYNETDITKYSEPKRTTAAQARIVRFPIEINSVTYEQLLEINGIGETLANRIINFRSSVDCIYNMDMLLQINGIGETKLAELKKYLYVSNENYKATTTTTTKPLATVVTKSTVTTATTKTTVTVTVERPSVRRRVNINKATAAQISECLLIDMKIAEKIIELRNKIHYFTNSLELLYVDGFSEQMHAQLKDYICV